MGDKHCLNCRKMLAQEQMLQNCQQMYLDCKCDCNYQRTGVPIGVQGREENLSFS